MYQLGVTGGIGSGKTLVCSILEKLGIPVYYADREARRLMESEGVLREKLTVSFGEAIFRGGKLNREALARRVFADASQLAELNALVHPAVREDYVDWVARQQGVPYVVEEAAILFESGADRFLDGTVLVYAPESLRIRRVMERDGVDEAHVVQRMGHQMDEDEKRKRADRMILNDGTRLLLPQVIELHHWVLNNR